MEYKELSKLYHSDKTNSRDTAMDLEYERRLNADSTFRLGFNTSEGELFIATPRELSLLNERILRTERKISNLVHSLPPIASNAVLRGLVLDEVVSTNSIENIHSTRKQVKEALESLPGTNEGTERFRELAVLYLNIINEQGVPPNTPEDIRTIYDLVTQGEIPKDQVPDGQLFRAHGVEIIRGGGKVVHTGLEPESTIIAAIKKMTAIAQQEEIPSLYRGLAAHYMFEYIHPFYDGNGRTGRYLLSYMLRESLSAATALSLSRTIAENREAYYQAFTTTEKKLNHGELTFFIHTMLELIREAQLDLEERLEQNTQILDQITSQMQEIKKAKALGNKGTDIVFMLMQYEAFGLFGDATINEIAAHLRLKPQMTRKHLSELETKNIVAKREKRKRSDPLMFGLTSVFKEKIGISTLENN